MKSKEQIELENSLENTLSKFRESLKDSPNSLELHKQSRTSYYLGFCDAKGWEIDLDFISNLSE